MKTKYLVPCACGRKIAVETTRAGQTVECGCGARVEVPTLRELTRLERVEAKSPARRVRALGTWGPQQQRLLLGGVIAVPALVMAAYFYVYRPRLVDIDTLEPLQVWTIWLEVRGGADRRPNPAVTAFEESVKMNQLWIGVTGAAGAIGVLIMASGLLMREPRAGRRARGASPKGRDPASAVWRAGN